MGKPIKRFFRELNISNAGHEITSLLGNNLGGMKGFVKSIVVTQHSGSATEISSLQIRYESSNEDLTNLVYSASAMTLTSNSMSDSYIDAPFDLGSPEPFEDLILYIEPDATGIFTVRVDFEISL